MKKIYLIFLLGAMTMMLGSCGGANDPASSVPDSTPSSSNEPTTSLPSPSTSSGVDSGSSSTSDIPDYGTFSIVTEIENAYSYDESTHTYTIHEAGDYVISGNLEGSLVFDESLTTSCSLDLNNVYIYNENGPAIAWLADSKKLEMKSVSGTVNYLIEGEHEGEDTSAAVLSENNLEVGGSGTIYIEGNYRHGIKGSEVTLKGSGEIHVTAAKNAVHAKYILVKGATTYLEDCAKGLSAEKNSKGNKGNIDITGGTLYINRVDYAMVAETDVVIGAETEEDVWPVIAVTDCVGDVINTEGEVTITYATFTVDGAPYQA